MIQPDAVEEFVEYLLAAGRHGEAAMQVPSHPTATRVCVCGRSGPRAQLCSRVCERVRERVRVRVRVR